MTSLAIIQVFCASQFAPFAAMVRSAYCLKLLQQPPGTQYSPTECAVSCGELWNLGDIAGSGVFTAYIDIEIVSCFMLFSILGVRLKGRSAIWSGQIVGELILILPS